MKLQVKQGVSPVIGVILMVAITIILAAVIGAFVLSFSGGESPPQTSFTVDQEEDPFEYNGDEWSEATVTFTHNGGENADTSELSFAFPDSDLDRVQVGDEGELAAGESITVDLDDAGLEDEGDIEDGDRVNLAWEGDDTSQTLRVYNINVA